MEGHQSVMGANGIAEGAYAAGVGASDRTTAGRKVVDGVSAVTGAATNMAKGFWGGVKKGYADAEAKRKNRYEFADDDANPAHQVWRPESNQSD